MFGLSDAGAAIGGSLLGTAADVYNTSKTNEMNQAMAREQMVFNQAEAQKNREFQERMSNTAYQRSMDDMRAAGLNPMLAKMSGGASMPSGSQATSAGFAGARAAEIGDKLNRAITTGLEAKRLHQDLKTSKSVEQLNLTSDKLKNEEIALTQQSAKESKARENEFNARAEEARERIRNIRLTRPGLEAETKYNIKDNNANTEYYWPQKIAGWLGNLLTGVGQATAVGKGIQGIKAGSGVLKRVRGGIVDKRTGEFFE